MNNQTHVWIMDDNSWSIGKIININTNDITVENLDNNQIINIPKNEIKMKNDDKCISNLIDLTHLHEPAILFKLNERYIQDIIYTYTGYILIAINPFKDLSLYSQDNFEYYKDFGIKN